MPIRSKIDIGADAGNFKESLALFQKYRDALSDKFGGAALQAPYIKTATAAGTELAKFVGNLDKATESQNRFATATQKAAGSFKNLAGGVKSTLENLARYALSPLQILFPAGLAVGLAGLGAGLAGVGAAGALYGLDTAAAGVSDQRRRAMGLGVSYGSLSAYDLNFSRFGVGEGTLGAVAGGIYDFTSPQYLGLRSSGSTGGGDTADAAVELIRSIPKLLQGVPDRMVGSAARSRNLTSLLDLPTIIRLRAHPEEIEAQVRRYQQDRKSLDISKEAQEKWSSFTAALERAGQNIETALGKNLVALTPGLTKVSEGIVNIIEAAFDSGAVTDALKGIESGLRGFTDFIGSASFREDAKSFLRAIEALEPYAAAIAKVAGFAVKLGVGGYKLFADPNYNPTLAGFVGDLAGVKSQDAPVGAAYNRLPSIRNYAGHGKDRPVSPSGVIDQATGKLTTGPSFKFSPASNPAEVAGIKASEIQPLPHETPQQLLTRVQATYPHLSNEQCVTLVRSVAGIKEGVWDWRRGVGAGEGNLPPGTPIATFMGRQGQSSEFYDAHQGYGAPGNNTTHTAILMGYTKDGIMVSEQYLGSGGPQLHEYKWGDPRGGEKDARNYFSVNDTLGLPAGENNPYRDSVLQAISDKRFAQGAMARGHILDQMHKGAPPGPIVVHDMTGGSAHVTVSRHEASL